MRRAAWIALALGAPLVLGAGCKKPSPESQNEIENERSGDPAESGIESEGDDRVSSPEQAWAWLGLVVDRGEAVTTNPDFVRIVTSDGDRDALVEHYRAQLLAGGWQALSREDTEAFRAEVLTRGDMRLALAANDEAGGGAGLGITLGQYWPALPLPRDGALEVLEAPATWIAVFPAGEPVERRLAAAREVVAAAGWTEDRTEAGAAPDAAGEVRVVWYRQEIRALRLEAYEQIDGEVRVGVQVGWR